MKTTLTYGSLFTGVGGIDIGFDRAGMECLWMCEKDKFCQKVLRQHWPKIKLYEDILDVDESVDRPDVLCGGFPCTDISVVNTKGKGLDGENSGLWFEYLRVIRLLRPRYILVENSPNIFTRGFNRLLGGLASLRYNAEWQILSAAQFRGCHLRRRIFVVAYPHDMLEQNRQETERCRVERFDHGIPGEEEDTGSCISGSEEVATVFPTVFTRELASRWEPKPRAFRVDDGSTSRTHRVKAIGNAVVPAISEYIGKLILDHANKNLDF